MTELEREAEELIQRFEIANSKSRKLYYFLPLIPNRKQIGEMLVMIAGPREKRIAELETQIEKMKCCENCIHYDKALGCMEVLKNCQCLSEWRLNGVEND